MALKVEIDPNEKEFRSEGGASWDCYQKQETVIGSVRRPARNSFRHW